MTHEYLVGRARRWLSNTIGCGVVLRESRGYGLEIPDVIGWKFGRWSYVVECKTSRGDFLADRAKPFRRVPSEGLGAYRYMMTTRGVVKALEELPAAWGLVEVSEGGRVRTIRPATIQAEWNHVRELGILIAELRRYQAQGIRYLPLRLERVNGGR